MIQPEIELICKPREKDIDRLRLQLRKTMIDAGYLPHWKESYGIEKINSQALLKVNGKKVWEGIIEDFNKLPPEELRLLLQNTKKGFRLKRFLKVQASFFYALLVAFFPKCPFCWAAYMSLFSSFGLGKLPYQPWLLPVLIILLFLNIISLYLSRKRHGYKPLVLAASGALLITSNRLYWHQQEFMVIGALLLIIASLWNSLPKRMLVSLKYYFLQWGTKVNQ